MPDRLGLLNTIRKVKAVTCTRDHVCSGDLAVGTIAYPTKRDIHLAYPGALCIVYYFSFLNALTHSFSHETYRLEKFDMNVDCPNLY